MSDATKCRVHEIAHAVEKAWRGHGIAKDGAHCLIGHCSRGSCVRGRCVRACVRIGRTM